MSIKNYSYIIATMCMLLVSCKSIYANENQSVSIESPFIYENKIWAPGRVESSKFYITNNEESSVSIDRLYIKLKSSKDLKSNEMLDINSRQFKELSSNSNVKLNYKDKILFQDKLDNLLSEKGIVLSQEIDIKPNEKALLNMTIDMDENMNNDAQSLENIFSIGAAYKIDNDNLEKPDPGNPENPGTHVDGSTDGKLPQTGGIINSYSLLAIGTITIGTGILLNRKTSKEKGGKHHE